MTSQQDAPEQFFTFFPAPGAGFFAFGGESLFPSLLDASAPLAAKNADDNAKNDESDEDHDQDCWQADERFLNETILNPSSCWAQAELRKKRRIRRKRRLLQRREEASRRQRRREVEEDDCNHNGNMIIPKKRRRTLPISWTDIHGINWQVLPRQSWWFNAYLANPNLDSDVFHKKFRLRFRLPYAEFLELVQLLEQNDAFSRWHDGKETVAGAKAAPISLLVLTALRYLGRGWTFDDCAENTAISPEVIRVFFHVFIGYGATELYERYVNAPASSVDASSHMHEYEAAGFPGAVGSTDATHIMIERVSHRFRQTHMGFKMSHTARTYNITVNHRRRILATTKGHPARWNDKTLILYDDFICGIHQGEILNDVRFELYDYATNRGDNNEVVRVKYQGAWVLVDNGYLNWPSTVPPIKSSNSRAEIRFSAWLESLRKDVECTFGILKGRWRILKTGVRLSGVHAADSIFLTCCALHNWLLFIDGLDDRWEEGLPSDWEGEMGEVQLDDMRSHDEDAELLVYEDEQVQQEVVEQPLIERLPARRRTAVVNEVPDALFRLNNPVARRNYGGLDDNGAVVLLPAASTRTNEPGRTSGVADDIAPAPPGRAVRVAGGVLEGRNNSDNETPRTTTERPRKVRELTLPAFRAKLITHFDIAYKRNEIVWPKRTGRPQPVAIA